MRFMFSYQGINKLMTNGTNFNKILNFVHENYKLKVLEYHMHYIDHEGDAIALDSQTDFQIMLENNMKEQIKIYIQAINDKVKPVEQNFGQPVQQDKINQHYAKIEENIQNEKYHIKQNFKNQDIQKQQQKINVSKQQNLFVKDVHILQKQMEQKIVKLVDERIKTLMPLIKKQIKQQLKQKKIQQNFKQKPTIHKIKCNACGVQPIIGIRYKCTKCFLFNICQNCQIQKEHNHNMIKMKYVEEQQQVANVKLQQKKQISKLLQKQKSLLMQQVKLQNKSQKQPLKLFYKSNIIDKNEIKIKQNTQQNYKVQKIPKETKIQQPKIDKVKVDKVQKIVPPIVTIPIFSPANIVKSTKKTNMGKRNQCVLLMKQMFGENNIYSYIQFFKKHSEETIETIIQLYVQENGKNN